MRTEILSYGVPPITLFRGKWETLSNFYGEPFAMRDPDDLQQVLPVASSEHHYQALKSLDPKERARVYACETPGEAKRVGQTMTTRPHWDDDEVPRSIMLQVLRNKFAVPDNWEVLHATGNRPLIEGNSWHDMQWGQCFCPEHKGTGKNLLGAVLEEVRDLFC